MFKRFEHCLTQVRLTLIGMVLEKRSQFSQVELQSNFEEVYKGGRLFFEK